MDHWAVYNAHDEVVAIAIGKTVAEIELLNEQARLWEAAACGHPAAPGWVEKQLPLETRQITFDLYEELLEDFANRRTEP